MHVVALLIIELHNLVFFCFILLFYLPISRFSEFFFSYFFKFILFCFAWGNDYIFGNGESRSDFFKEKEGQWAIYFLEWKIRMGRRVSFKGIYGFGRAGGNLQERSTCNHHWKVMRATTIGKWCGELKNGQHVFTMRVKGDSAARERGISSVLVNEWSQFFWKNTRDSWENITHMDEGNSER